MAARWVNDSVTPGIVCAAAWLRSTFVDPAAIDLAELDAHHHEVVAALRSQHPVAWVPALGGWLVTSRDDAVAVMRDPAAYTVDDPRFSTAQVVGESMLSLDGDEHQRHRAPFADPLRPAETTARYREHVDTIARDLVSSLRSRGAAELRRDLAGPLAVAVSSMVLGLDEMSSSELLEVYDCIVAAVNGVSRGDAVSEAGREAFERLAGHVRSASQRPGTLIADVAGSLTAEEVVSNSAVFLFGGIETSEGMTTNVLHHLLAEPAQWAAVVADRSLVDAAVEESLRLEPAAARVDRYATRDVVLAGAEIRRGDLVIVSLAGANRDPAAFTDPDRFDLARSSARTHVAFAHGPHACIAAQLARLQTRAAVHAVIDLLPDVELVGEVTVAGVIFRKPVELRVTWRAT